MPRRALVCEDDQSIRIMVAAVLGRARFEVVSVTSGTEAVAIMDEPFDVIILDLMMPGMNGYDVLQQIEDTNAALLERVIVVTAHIAYSRQPPKQKTAAILIKPFDIAELMAAVQRIVGEP